jgi:type II secretory pathway component GspD/PulD (secretin)
MGSESAFMAVEPAGNYTKEMKTMAAAPRVYACSLRFALAFLLGAAGLFAAEGEAGKEPETSGNLAAAQQAAAGPGLSGGTAAFDAASGAGTVAAPSPEPHGGPAGKPAESSGKSGEPAKPDASTKPIVRAAKPPTPPKPEELKVRPDQAGRVRLQFNGQPWPAVLEWLAKISEMSLDWQELPGDYLNLTTQRSYTVAEVRDLINRHLLARGFTLLREGEVLTVANIKKLDPSLVPRLEPEELARRDPHEFAKVSFPLLCLAAETAVDELKPMLSPNGKLAPLAESNRLEAMDAVANLRDIYAVLKEQQSAAGQDRSVRKFKLKYARANEVHDLLETLLGPESKTPGPQGPQQGMPAGVPPELAAMLQAAAAAGSPQPQGQQGRPSPGADHGKPKAAVLMAVNDRQNSILVHARPEKMAMIAQVIEAVDVPVDRNVSLLADIKRMQVYRLAGIDPEPVVKTLQEIGNLDPTTRLEVDKKNKAIVAYASLADHVTIRAVVDKLTGSERKFDVIRLRHLSADYVAGTIASMMGGGEKKEKPRSNPFWFGGEREPSHEPEKPGEFRVDADVEHNRLLLWANDVEVSEVENLLVKLGEMPGKNGSSETVRTIDLGDEKETEALLARIRRAWPSVAPNPLVTTPEKPPASEDEQTAPPPGTTPFVPQGVPPSQPKATSAAPDPRAGSSAAPEPVEASVTPDGKLLFCSRDTEALDRMEDLAARLAAARKKYTVYQLKYAAAAGVVGILQDYFKDEKKPRTHWLPWWFDEGAPEEEETTDNQRRLSTRPKLRFIADTDTNSILVAGAEPSQLKTVAELVEVYDRPPPTDSESARKTEVIFLKYSKAKTVAETIKDVYRDLLSANDKALSSGTQAATQQSSRGFTFSQSDSDKGEQKVPKFKGLLSIGVDELSNTLAVSAPTYLFDHVSKMITALDEAAAPNYTVRVVKIGPGTDAARLRDVLGAVLQLPKHTTEPASPTPPATKPKDKSSDRSKSTRSGKSAGS